MRQFNPIPEILKVSGFSVFYTMLLFVTGTTAHRAQNLTGDDRYANVTDVG